MKVYPDPAPTTEPVVTHKSSPHPRGDGPGWPATSMILSWFSPPAWGWSEMDHAQRRELRVLPTAWGWSVITPSERDTEPVLPTRVGMVRFDAPIS
jgi:hypothetical protein